MPVHTRKSTKGTRTVYKVVDTSGKVFGTHRTKKKAVAQVRAVNIHMGVVPGVKPRRRPTRR
jgi:hypothetical protein